MRKITFILYICIFFNTINAAIIGGNPNGSTSIDFVYDYQCEYCHKMWQEIKKIDVDGSNLKIKLHPIYAINETSLMQAASMIYLAQNNNNFFDLNDYLLSTKPLSKSQFISMLEKLFAVGKDFVQAVRSQYIKEQIDEGIEILSQNQTDRVPFVIIKGKNGKTKKIYGFMDYKNILKEITNVNQ